MLFGLGGMPIVLVVNGLRQEIVCFWTSRAKYNVVAFYPYAAKIRK